MPHNLRSLLTFANVASALALFVVIGGGAAYAAGTIGSGDVIDESLRSADLKDGAGVKSADVKDAPSGSDAIDADTVDGQNAAELTSGRIRGVGSTTSSGHGGPFPLLPGLEYSWSCSPGAFSRMTVVFGTNGATGTANAMTVASGIEGQPYEPEPAVFNLANGPTVGGFPFAEGHVWVLLPNSSGDAMAETQLILDVGARTYSVALHQYLRASDGYCETSGTATLGT
jgi:hypothetical protein